MTEQCSTLVYCVGGLARGTSSFADLCRQIEHQNPTTHTFTGEVKNKPVFRVHSYRQSTCVPFLRWPILTGEGEKEPSSIPTFTDQTAEDLATQLDTEIERTRRELNATKIIIIAYSAGSALVRRALLQAKNRELSREILAQRRAQHPAHKPVEHVDGIGSWSNALQKVIHIGGMNLGWEFNSQMPKQFLWLGPVIRPLCPYWFPWQIYRGSKFIVDTRIGLNRFPISSTHQTFYLLGTQDQFLSPGDAVEPGSIEGNQHTPIYLEVFGVDHNSILNYKKSGLDLILSRIIISVDHADRIGALIAKDGLARIIPKLDIDDYLDPMDNEPAYRVESVNHVVVVLHGIRDSGFWAKRIAHRIKEQNRKAIARDKFTDSVACSQARIEQTIEEAAKSLRVVSLSYGYFSLWDFLRPGGRRQAVEWFQNVYADITALYPKAEVSFIGHSNGTYLGTHALQCENVNYRYLLLAGSVVRCNFWDTKGKEWEWRRKVRRLLNIQGVDDWIVGLLPGGLETIPILGKWMDLGGLGAYGNQWLKPDVEQVKLMGGHGAGIIDKGWDHLARFVLHSDPIIAPLPVEAGSGFSVVSSDPMKRKDEMRLNTILGYLRPLGGLYIYLAMFICFSPLFLILWISLHQSISGALPENTFHVLTSSWGSELRNLNMLLPPLLQMPPLKITAASGFALLLLLPLGILGLALLGANALATIMKLAKNSVDNARQGRMGEKIKIQPSENLLIGLIGLPFLALLITKGVALALQGPQSVMALLIVLSILSFSLLKRI